MNQAPDEYVFYFNYISITFPFRLGLRQPVYDLDLTSRMTYRVYRHESLTHALEINWKQ